MGESLISEVVSTDLANADLGLCVLTTEIKSLPYRPTTLA